MPIRGAHGLRCVCVRVCVYMYVCVCVCARCLLGWAILRGFMWLGMSWLLGCATHVCLCSRVHAKANPCAPVLDA